MTSKSKLKKIQKKAVVNPPVDPFAILNAKVLRMKELQAQIVQLKGAYAELDKLKEEMIPYFVTVEPDRFTINRKLILGTKTYNIHPFFFDEKKGIVLAKTWKSVAHETFNVE